MENRKGLFLSLVLGLFSFVFLDRVSLYSPSVTLNSLCSSGYPQSQDPSCLSLPSAGIVGVHHHTCYEKFSKRRLKAFRGVACMVDYLPRNSPTVPEIPIDLLSLLPNSVNACHSHVDIKCVKGLHAWVTIFHL
jgi:hypothetical protein